MLTGREQAVLASLRAATESLDEARARHEQRLRRALAVGAPIPRVAEAAGLSYDALRMRLARERSTG